MPRRLSREHEPPTTAADKPGDAFSAAEAERDRALAEAQRRAREEAALHELARELGAESDIRGVVEAATRSAVAATRAFGAYVERIDSPDGEVVVVAASGGGTPPIGTRVPYPGSLTEEVIESGSPAVLTEVGAIGERMAPYLAESCPQCTGLIVPLVSGGEMLGTLVLLRGGETDPFQATELAFARSIGNTASAAFARAALLESLRESEQRFRSLAENAAEAIITIDAEDVLVYANPAVEEIFGYCPDELNGLGFTVLIPERFRERHRAGVARHVRTGERRLSWDGIELPGLHRDGREIPLEITFGEFVRDGRHFFTGIMRDISERKASEEERERLLERERFLAEASRVLASSLDYQVTLDRVAQLAVPDIADYCVIDVLEPDGRLHRVGAAHVDPASAEIVLATRGDAPAPGSHSPALRVFETGESVLAAEVSEEWLEAVAQRPEHLELMRRLAPRSVIIVPLSARGRTIGILWLVTTKAGRTYGEEDLAFAEELARRAGVAVDNAELYAAAEAARGEAERRAREEAALRRATEAVTATFTVDEVIRQIAESALAATSADGAFVEQIDFERGQVRVVAVAGDRTPPLDARVPYPGSFTERAMERGEPQLVPHLGSANRPLPKGLVDNCGDCSAVVVPLLDAADAIGALFLLRGAEKQGFRPAEVDRALTFGNLAALAFRKVHLLQDSQLKREELEHVTESRVRLIRGFSHDIKNPLNASDGFLALLEDGILGPITDKQKESIGRARRSLGSALGLINDLVELARAESGQLEIRPHLLDVREVAREMAEEYRPQAEAKGLEMRSERPSELPMIENDGTRIRQILGNLISNAVKYTRQGSVAISVGVRSGGGFSGRDSCIAVDVSDTGPGIPEEQRHLLFREFSRLDPEATHGAGLGLAISHRIAAALGGKITVDSDVGRGSTFTLWLPLRPRTAGAHG